MKSICIITVYFGNFPNYFNLWLASCAYNSSIDFKIVTDQNLQNLPENVTVFKTDLVSFKKLAENKLKRQIRLESPYKCCDYKPMYGLILEDELRKYDFWGHCDIDMIFGDIRKFVSDSILQIYRKIYLLGHLSLYKNDELTKNAFKLPGSARADYHQVISTDKICVFDERYGIDLIFKKNSLLIYDHIDFADIDFCLKRMTAVGLKNFDNQIFCYCNGKVIRFYIEEDKIKTEEFVYIHLQKRKYSNTIVGLKNYIITSDKFIPITEEIDSVIINNNNTYRGKIFEAIEYIVKSNLFRIRRRLKGTHL